MSLAMKFGKLIYIVNIDRTIAGNDFGIQF